MNPIYQVDLKVPAEVVDGNGHVNNVAYVQWMQDAAIRHSRASGCTQATEAIGGWKNAGRAAQEDVAGNGRTVLWSW